MGAVNCAVRRDDKFIGENTDGKGFLKSLTEAVTPAGKRAVLFGAGGAARAIAVELALAGVSAITVVNRSKERGRSLVDLLNRDTKAKATLVSWDGDYKIPDGTDIVVNATSIGLYPDLEARLALDISTLKPGMVVADVIANPPKPRLIRDAEARGCAAISGRGMLVNQGVIGIRYWTGVDVDPAVMQDELARIFGA
jgi:shikimate dehydrogenase